QMKVLDEILHDISQPQPMSRLLQGDVGSGKTIVALLALLMTIKNGFQGAFMAPTEILAEQHYNTILKTLSCIKPNLDDRTSPIATLVDNSDSEITIALLTGKQSEKNKLQITDMISEGKIDLIIGTHALIQKGVAFKKLGLVVIDEQHRFGVMQRNELRQKGYNPHMLVMTATPIPRTLALTLYGDLDISVIDELPPGRMAIITRWMSWEKRQKAYEFICRELDSGHQAFIICPLIEESDTIEARAAISEHKRLSQDIFPGYKLGLLHGRMPPDKKDQVMTDFRRGEYQILVATPVVEVGIDIPNATVILIEAADRFGLSQLHQFRGRVGRGTAQSYCMLLSEKPSDQGIQRLRAIEEIQNGFVLAEKDMELRGPGEFFGTRQSGMPDLRMAKLSDIKLVELAREQARQLFAEDPGLKSPENEALARELKRIWPSITEWS
ncbi:MAG TPA: ATP-dependent DNA helicase RecG, partial [Dehalococcoidia bacterium]|nr:ATP-dependent DNA helicase RecG [Dehalococcoidia bacterium]